MATKPRRPCGKAGCRNLTSERYCADHAYLAEQQRRERHRHYDRYQRDQDARDFYHSTAWQAARRAALMRDAGLCQHCKRDKQITLADMVHHIHPIKSHWELRLTLSNLVSLCNTCHAKIDHRNL